MTMQQNRGVRGVSLPGNLVAAAVTAILESGARTCVAVMRDVPLLCHQSGLDLADSHADAVALVEPDPALVARVRAQTRRVVVIVAPVMPACETPEALGALLGLHVFLDCEVSRIVCPDGSTWWLVRGRCA